MNSRVNLDNKEAVVLHHFDYRDSSLLVNFFISDFGRVSAIAKGVKGKKKSKQAYQVLLQPFQKLMVSLSGKQELLLLKNIEATTVSWKLSGKSLYCAYYVNELLLRLLPTYTDCREIFQLYNHVLNLLVQCSSVPVNGVQETQHTVLYEAPLRLFELKLLEFLGYGLNLTDEIQSGLPVDAKKHYYYVAESGPSEMQIANTTTLPITGRTLINLSNGQLSDPKTLQESKQLLKWALSEHLGSKPLKSRQLFKQLYC
ncbi:MAG: DNA repair protein RecO [Gammaproteobacteria bacterium]|nr:DNA repair protein RecO [Gammaproteobacteria bacterium]